jgi:CDP-6-deoxy-D-xylo-4-hexulose-3-dehydrase
MKEQFIHVPYGKSVHGQEEMEAVKEVLKTSTQMGPRVREMEEKIATLFDKKYGLMVNSGTSALYLSFEVLDLLHGSEVITPATTFSSTVACLIKTNLVPVYVDVEEGTYCLNIDQVETMISEKTKAVCIPNLLGNVPDWDRIANICKKHDLKIIEDSADTLGATLRGRSTGHHSDISITSFYGSHVINCAGNGGMLCLNDTEMYRKGRLLRSWGRRSSIFDETASEALENRFDVELDGIPYDAKFVFEILGYQLEPSELGAAFGLVQLKSLENNIAARERNFEIQFNFFRKYEDWFVLPKQTLECRTGWLAFPLTLRDSAPFNRRDLMTFLENRNIQTRVVMAGNILRQPGFKSHPMRVHPEGYPEADKVMRGGFLLACHHGLSTEQIAHVHESFELFAQEF